MEQRTLELELVSAKDLKDVNLVSKMDVYAVVSLVVDNYHVQQKAKSSVSQNCGTHPTFNFPMRFAVDESLLLSQQNRLDLDFKLVCDRSLGDKDIGVVRVPVKELFDSADPKSMKFVSYQVRRPSGKPKGELSFSYKFGEKVAAAAPMMPEAAKKGEPVTAYPSAPVYGAYPSSSGSSYPPAQTGYGAPPPGYGYPPQQQQQPGYAYPPLPQQAGYGYPPPQPGYGYPPVVQPQPEKKKSKFGMGLGAGLLGGVLGGMLIGDMVSDVGGGCGGGGCGGGGCGGF